MNFNRIDPYSTVFKDKENYQKTKVLRENQSNVSSPCRTPLGDVRNKLQSENFVLSGKKKRDTPLSSRKQTPLRCLSKSLVGSKDSTPKRQPSLKKLLRAKCGQSDKKVRFNLEDKILETLPQCKNKSSTDQTDDEEEELLDRQIEGFISSILTLTVNELRQEQQNVPEIKLIPPTPSPGILLHEDTPETAEQLSKQFSVEIKDNAENTKSSPGKSQSKIPVSIQANKESNGNCASPVSSPVQKLKYSPLKLKSLPKKLRKETKDASPKSTNPASSSPKFSACIRSPKSPPISANIRSPKSPQSVVPASCDDAPNMLCHRIKDHEEVKTIKQNSLDMSVTNETDIPSMTSVATSPIRNVSVVTSDDVVTCDSKDTSTQTVPVKPLADHKMTMTDPAHTKTCETSMTPVKTLSKSGKRLTAEEVRRQHPRAIANQLDTTLVCNERLKIDLKSAERERDKLKLIVRDLRESIMVKNRQIDKLETHKQNDKSELEELHFSVVRDFQTKIEAKDNEIDQLEREVNVLRPQVIELDMRCQEMQMTLRDYQQNMQNQLDIQEKQYKDQLSQQEMEFEQSSYKSQFESSQQIVRELQAQLDEFADIMEDLHTTERLQEEVHCSITDTHRKLRQAGLRNADMRKRLISEYVSMKKVKQELVTDIDSYKLDNSALKEENDSLLISLAMSHDSLAQLQSLYSSTSNDLLQATSQVCQMNVEIAAARKALQDLVLTKEVLVTQLGEHQDKEAVAESQIHSLQQQLMQINTLYKDEQIRKEDWERIALDNRAVLEDKIAEYELCVKNLERTLEYRDHDIDILEKDLYECREIILEQRHSMEEMDAQHKTLHAHQVDQTELKALRGNVEFLEAERTMLIDSLRDSEEQIRNTCCQLNQQQKTLVDTNMQFQQFQSTIHSLQQELHTTRNERDCGRREAIEFAECQREEQQIVGQTVAALEEKMYTILGALKKKVGGEIDGSDTPMKMSSESLVSKVLRAATKPDPDVSQTDTSFAWSQSRPRSGDSSIDPGDSGYSNTESLASPGEASRAKLGYSNSSAFAPVKNRNREESPKNVMCDADDDMPLAQQIETLSGLLSDIISMANILEKASALSLQDLKGENSLLKNKVIQLEGEVARLQHDRNYKTEELTEANQLVADLKERIRKMGERIIALSDYQFEQGNMRGEFERLLGEVKRLQGERDILTEQLEHASQSSNNSSAAITHDHAHVNTQIVMLKRKNQQLLLQLSEEREHYHSLGGKAARKIRILEENWKKAEAEVFRFDELVDSIQKVLEANKDFISHNAELHRLMQVINGEETLHQSRS